MKKISVISLILLLMSLILFAETNSLTTTAPTNEKDIHNADFYYNKGVDYYAKGNQGLANLYYLKALNLDTAHKFARSNLELSLRLSTDNKLYPQRLFLVRVLFQGLDFFSVNRLAIISLLLLFFTVAALAWLMFYNPDEERALPILVFSFLCLLCLSSYILLGVKSYRQTHNKLAVVLSSSEQVLPPSRAGKKAIAEVHEGLVVTLINVKDDMANVRLPNGLLGKLPAKSLAKVR